MGIAIVFSYLIGAALLALAGSDAIDGKLSFDEARTWVLVGGGGGLVTLGAFFHSLVDARRGAAKRFHFPRASFPVAAVLLAVWLGPLAWSWAQFERFVDPVTVYPVPMLLGAMGVVYAALSRVPESFQFRAPLIASGVAVLGLFVGAMTISRLEHHLRFHQTAVLLTYLPDTETGREGFQRRLDPELPSERVEPFAIGDATLDVVAALGSPLDVATEVREGRMRLNDAGLYERVESDGGTQVIEVGGAQALNDAFDQARSADQERRAKAQAAHAQAWQDEVAARKRGGRLFSK